MSNQSISTASIQVGFRFVDYSQTSITEPLARRLNVPYCEIDGTEHLCRWGEYTSIDVPPGTHTLLTYLRRKGLPMKSRKAKTQIDVRPGVQLTANVTVGQYKSKIEVS